MRNAYNVWLTELMINRKRRRKKLSFPPIYNYVLWWVIPMSDGTLFCNLTTPVFRFPMLRIIPDMLHTHLSLPLRCAIVLTMHHNAISLIQILGVQP
jgi:hypothetical protein